MSAAPPRIALFTPSLNGGIGKNVVNHSNELLRRGYAVSVLVHKRVPAYERQLGEGVELVPLITSHPVAGIPVLASFLRQRRPAAMRMTNVRLARLALRARTLARVPTRLVVSVHNTYSVAFREMDASKLQRRIDKWRRYYPRLDGIVAVSEGVREDFGRLTGIPLERITRIYNPVVTPELRQLATEPVDHPWFSDGGPPVIVSVGRLSVAKNFPLLIGAFERLRAERPARLLIVGGGTLHQQLQARVAHSPFAVDIELAGFRDNPFAFMARADLFVLSSDWEGLPTVLIEALACGAPVVSTDCPSGPREILEEGRYGPIVPIGDAPALSQAMGEVLDAPPDRAHQREGAERFTVERSIDAYLDLFRLPRMANGGGISTGVSKSPALIALFAPEIEGGIGRNTINHARELAQRGFDVDVLIERQTPGYDEQLGPGIALHLATTTHPVAGIPWMLRYLLRRRPAAISVSNVRLAMLALRARALARVHTRIVATVHNTYSLAYARLEAEKLKKRIAKYRAYYPRLDAIVAVSEGVREDFARFADIPIERIRRIYNPIVTDDLDAKAAMDPGHPWLAGATEPVILSVGRLSVAKNFPLLIGAFERLRAERPARLLIVGGGSLHQQLQARVERSPFAVDIELAGFRDNPFAFMARADLFVLSSDWEGFGNVLAEALACGAPVVATDCPSGPREILEGGRYGRLVPVGDEQALAAAMIETLDHRPDRAHQREGARRFSVAESTEAYLDAMGLPRRV